MNPVATAMVGGSVVVVGKWSRGKAPTIDNAVGIAGIALGLSVLEQMSPKLSNAFSALILVSILVAFLPDIVKAAGFAGAAKGK